MPSTAPLAHFDRLRAEHDVFVNAALAGVADRLGLVSRGLTGLLDAMNRGEWFCFAKW